MKQNWIKEFDEIFIKTEDWPKEQRGQSYPCYLSDFQKECVLEFIQSQLNKRDEEIIERIEQLKWEGRLTGLQILDRLIEDIKNNL